MAAGVALRLGQGSLTPEQGTAAFDLALRTAEPVLVPIMLDLPRIRAGGDRVPAVLRGLVRSRQSSAQPGAAPSAAPAADRLGGLTGAAFEDALIELVRSEVAAELGYSDPSLVDTEDAFTDLGFDSLSSVQLRSRLAVSTGVPLPATVVFDHPSPAALARRLHAELTGSS
jgi:acyl carrier protein